MNATQEARQDAVSELQFVFREEQINARRLDLSKQAKALHKRARQLRARLEALDPESAASAELTGRLEDVEEDIQWVQYGIYQLTADALATVLEDGEVEYKYTAADVKAWCDRAEELGVAPPQIRACQLCDLVRMRSVPNAPLRDRYEASERSEVDIIADVHRHLRQLELEHDADYGAKHFVMNGHPQTRQAERVLGIQPKDTGSLRLFIPYEMGVAFARALDMTPQEAGL